MATPIPTFQAGEAIRAADLNLLAAALRELMGGTQGGAGGFGAVGGPADSGPYPAARAGPTGGPQGGWFSGRVVLGRIFARPNGHNQWAFAQEK